MAVQIKTRAYTKETATPEKEGAGSKPRLRPNERPVPRRVGSPIANEWYLPLKNVVDKSVAAVLLLLALPVIGAIALLVKLTSRGPAFYTQVRVGQHGRLFTIYKVRTMVDKCESLTGPRWSIPGDPRITRVGQFLRLTHLDELPQLLNVLRGEMSLVGPRPERPEFLPRLERALPAYRDRLLVKPGVTGLAQVQLPADTDLGSVRRKLAHDLYYIENVSPWLDVRVLFCTGLYALGVPFWIAGRVFGVPSVKTEEADEDLVAEHGMVRPWVAA